MDGPSARSLTTRVASFSGASLFALMPFCGGSAAGPTSPAPSAPSPSIARIRIVGQPVLVWDHLADQRGPLNIPDFPPSAYKEADGTVDLMIAHFENYRMRGPDLEHLVSFPNIVFSSTTQASEIGESHYDYHHWLAAPYTFDGRTIYALADTEWYACLLNGDCAGTAPATSTSSGSYQLNSWANTVTALVSTDGGVSWAVNGADGAHVVGNESFTWTGSVALASAVYRKAFDQTGMFEPSRVIREGDYFYSVALMTHRDFSRLDVTTGVAPVDKNGLLLMRTNDPSKASGWEGWGSPFITSRRRAWPIRRGLRPQWSPAPPRCRSTRAGIRPPRAAWGSRRATTCRCSTAIQVA